jgi:sugar O-acyltransferase (sialic acid O-acetyltransferase NeuD family)
MTNDLIVVGAGGFGREASQLVEDINAAEQAERWNLLGFIDDDKAKWGQNLRGYKVLGGLDFLQQFDRDVLVIAVVSDPVAKKSIIERVKSHGLNFATLIHPDLAVTKEIKVGQGTLINKGCLLTINIEIGDHVSINPGCCIGHDAVIGDYSTLLWRVNLSGNIKIGNGCLLGTGSTVLQGLKVEDATTVGAGAVVTTDLPGNCTVVGVPARIV